MWGGKHCFPFRPGCCAKHGLAEAYKTSIDFPDETLSFIKSHPLMDSAVPPIAEEPWFTKTRIRWGWVERVAHSRPVPSCPVGLTLWLGSPRPAGTDWRLSLSTILPDHTRTTPSSLLAQKLAWYLKFWQRPVLSLWMTAYYWKRLKHTTMQSRYILRECSSALLKNFRSLFHLVISFQPSKLAVVWHISVLGFFFLLTEINPGFVFSLSLMGLGDGQLMSLKIIQPFYFTCGSGEHFTTTLPTLQINFGILHTADSCRHTHIPTHRM